MKTLHIHARDIVRYDAVGNFARQMFDLGARGGWRPRLWAEHSDEVADYPVGRREAFLAALRPGDVIFFNHSIFDPILPEIADLPQAKLYYFHNITSPELIDPADGATVANCRDGLAQRRLAGRFDALLANSAATAEVLLEGMDAGDRARWQGRVASVPPVVGLDRWGAVASRPAAADETLHLLFVGRLVPHKGLATLLDVFERLAHKTPGLVLDIVGGPDGGAHVTELKARAAALEGLGRGRIVFHHAISDDQLRDLYEQAAACLTFTRHEGFCVPILDALTFDRPMLTSALPTLLETAGGAALPVSDDPDEAAGQIGAFLTDACAQASNAQARRVRVRQLRDLCDGRVILDALESLSR